MPLGRQHKKHGLPFCRQPMLPGLMLTQVLSGLFASAVAPVSQSLVSESVQEPVLGMRYVNCQRTCRTHMHIICYTHYTHMFWWVENAYNIHTHSCSIVYMWHACVTRVTCVACVTCMMCVTCVSCVTRVYTFMQFHSCIPIDIPTHRSTYSRELHTHNNLNGIILNATNWSCFTMFHLEDEAPCPEVVAVVCP